MLTDLPERRSEIFRDCTRPRRESSSTSIEHASDQTVPASDPVVQAAAQRWVEVLGEADLHASEDGAIDRIVVWEGGRKSAARRWPHWHGKRSTSRSRRRWLAISYAELLGPLAQADADDLAAGLASADRALADIDGLRHLDPADSNFLRSTADH